MTKPTDAELARRRDKRALDALYQRQRRARQREERERQRALASVPDLPADQFAALESWAADRLVVPAGHPRAAEPMALPGFAAAWLAEALAEPGEALMCVARKNAKSAILAIYLLGRLLGPLRTPGYRGAVISVTSAKAIELRMQMVAIAAAAGLEGLTVRSTPPPGALLGPSGRVDILAATSHAGHASGFDDVVIDELGLLQERHRPMVMGVRSAGSARAAGRVLAISIHGSGPFIPELLARRDLPGTVVHAFIPRDPCPAIDDEAVWEEGNPGLDDIKSREYLRAEARRVLATPVDQPFFRMHDLNCPGQPDGEFLLDVATWRACETEDLPARTGECAIGVDLGTPDTLAALAAWWPSGRVEVWAVAGARPTLAERGVADSSGDLWQRMADRGELRVLPAATPPAEGLLASAADALAGQRIVLAAADAHRKREVRPAFRGRGIRWRWVSHQTAGADWSLGIRALAGRAHAGRLRVRSSLLARSALSAAAVQRDGLGQLMFAAARRQPAAAVVRALVLAAFADAARPSGGGALAF